VPNLRPIGDRAHRSDVRSPHAATRLPWMNTIASLRRLCVVWLAAVIWMAFQPIPSPAQPAGRRTAMKPVDDEFATDSPDTEPAPDKPAGIATSATNASNLAGPPPRILVLQNGRIVEGKISQSPGGYMVEKPNGSILVPYDRVQFGAQNRVDALQKFRETMPKDVTGSNVLLARWCLTYDMHQQAQEELRKALEKDPNNAEARGMLQRLEDLHATPRITHHNSTGKGPKTEDDFEQPDVESLGGLTRKTAQEFVQQIQPILVNRCANASCHGGSSQKEGFALTPGRGDRSSRVFAERNLAAVMKYIDFETPDRSALLMEPRGNHAGSKSVFSGVKGKDQYDALRQWVRNASIEQRDQRRVIAGRPKLRQGDAAIQASPPRSVMVDSAVIPAGAFEEDSSPPENSPKTADSPGSRTTTARRAFESTDRLTSTTRKSPPDAFDPQEFNRKSARKSSEEKSKDE
jgi:hypothetical protein